MWWKRRITPPRNAGGALIADDATVTAAQTGLDRLAVKLDGRQRIRDGETTTVGALAEAEQLRPAPLLAFPAEFDVTRDVTPQALVSFRGNHYSVPPGLGSAQRSSAYARSGRKSGLSDGRRVVG